jgi:hypothetical protein
MSSKSLLAVLPEVIRAINEDLIIKRLSGEIFFCVSVLWSAILFSELESDRRAYWMDGA